MTTKNSNKKLPHLDVTAGLIYNGEKILITQRQAEDNFGGFWEFPGGKKEPGESLEKCLIREIREELNIDIEVKKHLLSLDHTYDHVKISLHVFKCRYVKGIPENRGVQDWKWIELSGVNDFSFTAADIKVIKKLPQIL